MVLPVRCQLPNRDPQSRDTGQGISSSCTPTPPPKKKDHEGASERAAAPEAASSCPPPAQKAEKGTLCAISDYRGRETPALSLQPSLPAAQSMTEAAARLSGQSLPGQHHHEQLRVPGRRVGRGSSSPGNSPLPSQPKSQCWAWHGSDRSTPRALFIQLLPSKGKASTQGLSAQTGFWGQGWRFLLPC